MAAQTADPSFHYPSLPSSLTKNDSLAVADPHDLSLDEPLGVFRGLAYALIFQFLVGFVGYAGWVLLRHLR
jgi:hypothetical protein